MVLEALRYRRGSLQILDQLQLPQRSCYEAIRGVRDGQAAIRDMRVRLATCSPCPMELGGQGDTPKGVGVGSRPPQV